MTGGRVKPLFSGESHRWTCEAVGNRLTNTVNGVPTAYTYLKNGANPLNGQRLSSDGVNAYTWDVNGSNLTRNGAPGDFTFGYDPDNRLASIPGAATVTRTYDYDGRGAWRIGSDVATSYVYDGLDLVRDDTGPTTRDYFVGPSVDDQPAVSSSHILSFTQEDPARPRAGGMSYVFAYGQNAPTQYVDPLGLLSCSPTPPRPDPPEPTPTPRPKPKRPYKPGKPCADQTETFGECETCCRILNPLKDVSFDRCDADCIDHNFPGGR